MYNNGSDRADINPTQPRMGSVTTIPSVTQSALASILNVDPGIVVNMPTHCTNVIDSESFIAKFPCTIGAAEYVISITGLLRDIPDNIMGRGMNPLSTNEASRFSLFSRQDFVNDKFTFALYNVSKKSIVTDMTRAAWTELRRRIPATHPLSLIPQH